MITDLIKLLEKNKIEKAVNYEQWKTMLRKIEYRNIIEI